MRIIFDCRYTRIGRHDGISRYTASLVGELAKLEPVTMLISDERQLELLPNLPWILGPSPTSATEPLTSRFLNRFEPDVVFSPMQTIGPWFRKFTLVTTIHDLIYYSNRTPPRNLPWAVRLLWRGYHLSWAFQRGLLNHADAHLADSRTTRDLMLAHRLTRNPVTVVTLGTELESPTTARAVPTTRELVYMGSFMPYKNVDLLAQALHLLPGYRLHLLSRVSPAESEKLVALAPADSLEFHNGATDEAYVELLKRATALVTASKDEGFGLPLVEAMVLGTPVVVSDIPIFREIGGDAALYFDPKSPESFAASVQELERAGEWAERSRRSVELGATYRWDIAAQELLRVLKESVAARNR
jgi:glycosyltransferase involved in cell wall biosynthesis